MLYEFNMDIQLVYEIHMFMSVIIHQCIKRSKWNHFSITRPSISYVYIYAVKALSGFIAAEVQKAIAEIIELYQKIAKV